MQLKYRLKLGDILTFLLGTYSFKAWIWSSFYCDLVVVAPTATMLLSCCTKRHCLCFAYISVWTYIKKDKYHFFIYYVEVSNMEILVVTRKFNIRTRIHTLPLPKKTYFWLSKISNKKFRMCISTIYACLYSYVKKQFFVIDVKDKTCLTKNLIFSTKFCFFTQPKRQVDFSWKNFVRI
jgi:hypothetical protein